MTYYPVRPGFVRRRAYTLLEVTVALAISVVLLAALYVAISTQAHPTRTGRQIIEQSAVARAVLARITNDISPHLGAVDPRIVGANASQGTSSTSTGTTSTGSSTSGSGSSSSGAAKSGSATSGSGAKGSSGSSSGSSSSSSGSSSSSSSSQSSGLGMAMFNLGVQGDDSHLSLYVSQVPKELSLTGDNSTVPPVSDLRRISYWLAGGGDAPLGLARQEIKAATSTDGLGLTIDGDEASHVFAKEVTKLSFEYFDGTNWQTSWNGTTLKSDNVTPVGPPMAIAVTLRLASGENKANARRREMTVRHVVFLPASNGMDLPNSTGNAPQSSSGGTSP